MQRLKNKIPNIYHSFFPDFIEMKVPEERIATCQNCVLQISPSSPNVNTKCCTYYAKIPNYLLGGLLQDHRKNLSKGQEIARKLIKSKIGISPYGISKPVWYKTLENTLLVKSDRTQYDNEKLRCPFYGEEGNCTTWAYREHCCSTHFCFSVGGDAGRSFWKRLNRYLKKVEWLLAHYAAKKLGCTYSFSIANINNSMLNADDESRHIDEGKYKQIWNGWKRDEETFYIACYKIINQLTYQEYSSIVGEEMINETKNIINLLNVFKDNIIPDNLLWNNKTKIDLIDEHFAQLSTNLGAYEIEITKLPLLQAFDGNKLLINIANLAFKANNNLGNDISKLLSIGVLTCDNG